MATPLSAVRTMWSPSLLSSLRAAFCALVKLGLGGWEDLRTLFISALSSSASCWLSLVQVASMAVMYSKLGGCLGLTAKLGPLARTDLWAGVKGLLDRLMTHLGLGSSLEEPWLDLLGGMGVGLPSQEVELSSWEGWVRTVPGGCLIPCLSALGGYGPALPWWCWRDEGELFPSLCIWREEAWDELTSSEGRCEALGRKLLPSPGGRWAVARPGAWKMGALLPSEEGCTAARRELLPSPGGRWAIARLGRPPDAWILGELFPSKEGCTVARERIASFPGRKVSNCRTRETAWCLDTGSTVPFQGRVYSCQERIASFPRRKVSNCRTRETAWCLDTGRAVTFWGRVYSCLGRIASLPGREVSNGRCGEIAYDLTCRVGLTAYYLTVILGWTSTFREKVTSCRGIVSFPGRKESNGRGGVVGICLTNLVA